MTTVRLILANILPDSGRPVAGSLRVMGGRIEFKIDLGGKVFPVHVDGIEANLKKKNLVELAGQGEVRFVGEYPRVLEVGFSWPEDAKYFRKFTFAINGKSLKFEDDGSGGFVLTAEASEFDFFEQSAVTEKSAGHGFVHATLFQDGSIITRATQTPSDPSKQDLADRALEKIVADLRLTKSSQKERPGGRDPMRGKIVAAFLACRSDGLTFKQAMDALCENGYGDLTFEFDRAADGYRVLDDAADAGSDDGLYKLKNLEGMFTEAGNTKKKKT